VTRGSDAVYLSARELQLLRYFIEREGQIIPRTDLLRSVWGYENGTFTRTVDVHVASLRQKLETDPKRPHFILTVSGTGYQFKAFNS
jgi:two-component system alkaline phosphatase synthesis response regulator PhoP